MFASLALLAGLAAAMIMVSRSVRGRADWSDAVYPVFLLHWGHVGTLLVSGQLHVALVTTLAGLILVIMASDSRASFGLSRTARAIGSAPSPPTPLPGGEGRMGRWGAIVTCIGLLVWSAGELVSQTSLVNEPGRLLWSALEFLASGIGAVGLQWPATVGGMIALGFMGGVYMLVRRWWKQPGERRRLFGLLAWAGGFVLLSLCDLPQGQWRRPMTLAALGPCWIMLVVAIYGRSTFARAIPRFATLTGLALLWPWPVVMNGGSFSARVQTNTALGLEQGEALKKQFEAMQSDIDAGLPEMVISYRFSRLPNRIGPRLPENLFSDGLSLLGDQKIGMFAALSRDPDCVRVPADRVAKESGNYHLAFAGPRHIYGAWVKAESAGTSQPVTFEMSWKSLRRSPQSSAIGQKTVRASNGEDVLVWIDETVVEADIQCERGAVRIRRVDFLVPRLASTGPVR
jgi:hypothetical protein